MAHESDKEHQLRIRNAYSLLTKSKDFAVVQDGIEKMGQRILRNLTACKGDPFELGKMVGALEVLRELTGAPSRLDAEIRSSASAALRNHHQGAHNDAEVWGGSPDLDKLLGQVKEALAQ